MEKKYQDEKLSRRERQIMDVIFKNGSATVADVVEHLPDAPSSGSVRAMLNILAKKGLVVSREDGPRKVYFPAIKQEKAAASALNQVIDTFFGGSSPKLVATLLDIKAKDFSNDDLERMRQIIEAAEKGQE